MALTAVATQPFHKQLSDSSGIQCAGGWFQLVLDGVGTLWCLAEGFLYHFREKNMLESVSRGSLEYPEARVVGPLE